MAEESGQEKTEDPTPKRLREAREKGDIPRSKELNATVLLLAAAMAAVVFGPQVASSFAAIFFDNFQVERATIFDTSEMMWQLGRSMADGFWAVVWVLVVLLIAAIVGPIALGGWNFSTDAIQPKGSRMDPIAGIGRMFSLKSLVELLKAIAKFLVVAAAAILVLWFMKAELMSLAAQQVEPAMAHAVEMLIWAFLVISSTMITISMVDVPYQIYDHTQKLKMTLQEVKDEMKNTEGKPEVKGRIRQLQREIAQREMMSQIPEADVVITNPTHYSVALKYDPEGGRAPYVIAKGVDFIALKIREIAKEHEVPILTAPPLARSIYHTTEINEEIPAGLFKAVAQVLAYVFQLQQFYKQEAEKPGVWRDQDVEIPDDLKFDE